MDHLTKAFLVLIVILITTSCATRSNMIYFQDAKPDLKSEEVPEEVQEGQGEELITIRPYDVLQVRVRTPDDELNQAFRDEAGTRSRGEGGRGMSGFYFQDGYLVDHAGDLTLPFVGRVQVEGLTIEEARNLIEDLLTNYTPRAHVQVKFLTFKVYMFGEVRNPGLITVPNEKSTILEAISMGGDLTDMADRQQIKILRGDPTDPEVYELDFTQIQSFNSPGFELKPYDIVYVTPADRKFLSLISSDFNVIFGFLNSAFVLVNVYNLIAD